MIFLKLKVENGKLKIVVGNKVLLSANLIVPDHIIIIVSNANRRTPFVKTGFIMTKNKVYR